MRPLTLVVAFLLALTSVSPYVVNRNVKDYGAKGDGINDDSNAIIAALTKDRSYNPSTLTPALIHFPPGIYLINQTLPVVYYTQLVGDYNFPPILKFVHNGGSIRVLEAEGSWYNDAPQNNFFHQIRNFVIDMTSCTQCVGVHWQVAQATSLSNIYFKMGANTKNQGIWMENGSGGFISDLVFDGGLYGLWVGNQQFTSRNITIRNASAAGIYLNWNWAWTFQGLTISNTPIAVDIGAGTGSVTIIDSNFINCPIGVRTNFVLTNDSAVAPGVNSVFLENIQVDGQGSTVVVMNDGKSALTVQGSGSVRSWAQGHVWQNLQNTIKISDLSMVAPKRPLMLTMKGNTKSSHSSLPVPSFFQKSRPNFSTMVDVSQMGVVGDGTTDVTQALQNLVLKSANKDVLYFPHGIYLIHDTVYLPPGTILVGEAWSVLMAAGTGFSDPFNPKPMLKVGNPGEMGVAQLMDFVISTQGPQPGAKLVEWNMHDAVGMQGSCGVWDLHFRIGGAIGTNINPTNCPASNGTTAPASACTGAWGLFHITPTGSCYLENVWGWTADHDIDQHAQINVYNGRGFLCESQGPVWLYGTAMEHSELYQYGLVGAKNVFMGMVQTETPYYQPSGNTPFVMNDARDPIFCTGDKRCQMALALNINSSNNIFIYGTGFYSFFNTWSTDCLKTTGGPSCQLELVKIWNSHNIYIYALNTYGSVYMLTQEESYSLASANVNTFCSTGIVDLNVFEGPQRKM